MQPTEPDFSNCQLGEGRVPSRMITGHFVDDVSRDREHGTCMFSLNFKKARRIRGITGDAGGSPEGMALRRQQVKNFFRLLTPTLHCERNSG